MLRLILGLCGVLFLVVPVLAQEPEAAEKKGDLEERVEVLEGELKRVRKELDEEKEARKEEAEQAEMRAFLEEAEQEAAEGEQELSLDTFLSFINQQRLNALNPRFTVIGDGTGRVATRTGELDEDDRVSLREVELDLRAAIDPYANGVVILALEEEDGEFEVDVEEAYVTLETLPWNFRAKLGRFFVPFGNINRLHLHDQPWSQRPQPLMDFLGDEGFKESGVNVSWIAPPIGPMTLTLEATYLNGEMGEVLGGSDSDEGAYLGRAEVFTPFNETTFLTIGGNVLFGYNSSGTSQETILTGADAIFKWAPNNVYSLVLLGELFYLDKEVMNGEEHAYGAFGAVQVQLFQRYYLGFRVEYSNYDEQIEGSRQVGLAPYISVYTTEFLRFRVGYEFRERETTKAVGQPDLGTLFFQVTFIFGSHPVEPFWYNR